ncbi:MAG TPA: hypothetical protein VJA82_07220 [Sediminibacterium sp.]|uniref:hypothetical protein n=1 Tax=Sediminibacterium sp. TaxID=1917865 RepID=UPI0008B8CBF3|nr:hypothetical protein [Sediminibacterium sp.]OHC84543.1 MAG: hypothetical protein A2472_11320 [Sphingobacteriia bacterium RIFOXYC2_FULL_35_18]OHC89055.1 MAG: hypothetical protein A2546_09190 [Sphingobacteriia bacterium RIFOXYD2_FULL_35_12]HLD53075.1 hypothetical protein [Sediminibacterium sp.]
MEIFSEEEISKLSQILNLILPEYNENLPSASFIINNLNLTNSIHKHFVDASKNLCSRVENIIITDLILTQIKKNNFREFSVFVNLVLILYYSNKKVLNNLNVGSVPPFPEGNFVKEGDLYLLEQVFLKEKIYRE